MNDEVIDDWGLLRAIDVFNLPGQLDETTTLYHHVISKPGFQVLKEDEHLRALCKTLLELNILVRRKRSEVSHRSSSVLLFKKNRQKEYQDELDILVSKRDEIFNQYEMLRRLKDWDNTFLIRPKA